MKLLASVFMAAALFSAPALAQSNATGIVYNDRNANGVRDANEEGIPNVRVSNQRDVTVTDRDGRYKLPVTDDTILFVVKPRNWSTAVDKDQIPRFYYIHKPAGSPKQKFPGVAPTGPLPASVDFPLTAAKEPNTFKALLFGDTQTTNETEVRYLSHSFLEDLSDTDAAFGITLGDNGFDNPTILPSVARALSVTGIPWHYALGNHDENYDSPDDEHSTETFQRNFGPAYYSYDYGQVHFITLDDVKWLGGSYKGGLGEQQIAWLKNDLDRCPKGQLVVLSMHIPLTSVEDRAGVYRLLENRPRAFAIAGHTHWMANTFIGKEAGFNRAEPLPLLTNATTCGSWWRGPHDEMGLPISVMSDGAPNGYSVAVFTGNRYSVEFQAARRPADYQMSIYTPEVTAPGAEVFANVFAGSARSTVEMQVDGRGDWRKMERTVQADPTLAKIKSEEPKDQPYYHQLAAPRQRCQHLWRGTLPNDLPPGIHLIRVRTTDMYGHAYAGRRSVIVKP
ncbi:MAG TPA: calcineurin-like phosphoesterase family protein [Armatimonadota bacterium]|jgi:hypothetical protein